MYKKFIEKAKRIHGDKYDYSLVPSTYINNSTPTKIICKIHGIFEQRPDNHSSGKGCKKCAKISNTEEFIVKAKEKHGELYDYSLSDFLNAKTKVKIICKKHGIFEQLPSKHACSGYGCKKCANNLKNNIKKIIEELNFIHGFKYDYSLVNSSYINNRLPISIICKKHGVFKQSYSNHKRGHGCKKCHIENIKTTKEELELLSNNIHNGVYSFSYSDFISLDDKMRFVCPFHGEFFQKFSSHLNGHKCPNCARFNDAKTWQLLNNKGWLNEQHRDIKKTLTEIGHELDCDVTTVSSYFKKHNIPILCFKTSFAEKEIMYFLKSINLGNVLNNCRDIISPYELDIFIPDKNIAIEYCGLYWHSEIYKDKNYHANKLKLCQEKGIRLITIFEDEWIHRQEQVKSKLKSILGVDDRDKIFARKCKIIILSKSQKSLFFEQNHIQGNGPGSISYGLEYNGEIVAAITFIDQKQGKFTLNRYATSKHVVGGFSKLLEHFKRNHEWREIITFADLRWSLGELYEKNGFTLDKILKPDYSYVERNNRIHKFNYRHKNLKNKLENYDANLSEHDNCTNNKFYRIYDCGKKMYKLTHK